MKRSWLISGHVRKSVMSLHLEKCSLADGNWIKSKDKAKLFFNHFKLCKGTSTTWHKEDRDSRHHSSACLSTNGRIGSINGQHMAVDHLPFFKKCEYFTEPYLMWQTEEVCACSCRLWLINFVLGGRKLYCSVISVSQACHRKAMMDTKPSAML